MYTENNKNPYIFNAYSRAFSTILGKFSSPMCPLAKSSTIRKLLYLRNYKEHNQVFGIYEL